MLKESLGMIEVKGLVAAITVGDTMAKAANVHVRQKTLAKGHGWTTILVTGDVGSVNAALSAGKSIAVERGWLISSKVIARPASMLELALEPDVTETNNITCDRTETPASAVPEENEVKNVEVLNETPTADKVVVEEESSLAGTAEETVEKKTEATVGEEEKSEEESKDTGKKSKKAAPRIKKTNSKKK